MRYVRPRMQQSACDQGYCFIISGLIWLGFLTIFSRCVIRLVPHVPYSNFIEKYYEVGKLWIFIVASFTYSKFVLRKTIIEIVANTNSDWCVILN